MVRFTTRLIAILCASLVLLGVLAMPAVAAPDEVGGVPFIIPLTGGAEVPGPGDPDGSGLATLRLNPGTEQVCYELTVSNLDFPTTGAHIHRGTVTEAGPPVVHLTSPVETGTSSGTGMSSGCVHADRALILEIIQNPEQFYVNVHNADYPAGALRGQLG